MAAKGEDQRELVAVLDGINGQKNGLTGAQIALSYKAALADFVGGRTTRSSIAEVSKLLAGALQARKQEIAESEDSSSQKVRNFY